MAGFRLRAQACRRTSRSRTGLRTSARSISIHSTANFYMSTNKCVRNMVMPELPHAKFRTLRKCSHSQCDGCGVLGKSSHWATMDLTCTDADSPEQYGAVLRSINIEPCQLYLSALPKFKFLCLQYVRRGPQFRSSP